MLTGATLTQAKEAAAGAEESSYSRRSFKARAVSRKQSRFSLGCSVMYRVKLKQLEIFNFFLSCHTLSLAPSIEVSDTPAGSSTSFYAPASTFACVSRTLEVVLSLNETRRSSDDYRNCLPALGREVLGLVRSNSTFRAADNASASTSEQGWNKSCTSATVRV